MDAKAKLKGARLIDFTGKLKGAEQHDAYSTEVAKSLRSAAGNKVVVVVDNGFGFEQERAHLVFDHLNFLGDNPLCGPNDPCGERFPVVNEIYLTEWHEGALGKLPQGVLGGLKNGIKPDASEEKLARDLGAEFFSYNLVPTMIVAAHAGYKMVGIVIPRAAEIDKDLADELSKLVN
ncbi:MAG TPA: hypothetical protein V6C72_08930 [Chroococcales cyanobacterium]